MKRKVRILAIAVFLSGLMTLAFISNGTSAQSGDQQKPANPCNPCSKTKPQNPCNPCGQKKAQNPCNPCSPKKPANPCNPCGQKKPANPCNPCGGKKPANPCNPCGGTAASSEIYQPAVEYSAWLKINQKPILSQAHGGIFVTTFANPTAQDAIKSKTTSFPVGSVLVKESFADNAGKPGAKATIFGMEKTGDGWLWVTTDSLGHITGKGNSAQMQMCAQCHSAAKTDSAYLRKK